MQLWWLLVFEDPELVGRPERQGGTIADGEPAALGQHLVEEHLARAFSGATVDHEVVAGQAAHEVVLIAHHGVRHHAIVWPVDRGDRQATERGAGGRLDLGQGVEQALLLDGVVLVALAEIDIGTGRHLRRAEVDEQLGDICVGEESVVGGCRAASGGDHRHRDARGQAGQERERHRGAPAAAHQPGRPHPDQLHRTRTSLRGRLRPIQPCGRPRWDRASRHLRREAGTTTAETSTASVRSTAVLDPTLAERVAAKLKERGDTIAVAEGSCGGLISASLLAVPGASRYFVGGTVVYTRTAKEALYPGIETPEGMRGATEEWATWLAIAARERIGTTWGMGEGGAAGPTNPYGDPAGHAWLAVAGPDGDVETRHVLTGIDDRPTNMVEFARAAIELLDKCLSRG